DKAPAWLARHWAGPGPYGLAWWVRNQEVVLERNKAYWRAAAPFERVVRRHTADSAAQLLALGRGDIDAALNLTPDQLQSLGKEAGLGIVSGTSLDYLYMTLTSGAELNKALASRAARQAVAHAIDYDGILKGLMLGQATRPATFIPVGLAGSTAPLTTEDGYPPDPPKGERS